MPSTSLPIGITIRPLLPEEYFLASGPEGVVWPESAVILGAWRDDKLVGWLGSVVIPHIEGLWVDEVERESGGQIARELHRQVERASAMLGRRIIFAFVPDDKPGMGSHLLRNGYEKLPITIWGKLLNDVEEEGEQLCLQQP